LCLIRIRGYGGILNRKGSNIVQATMVVCDVIFGVDCGVAIGNVMFIGMVFAKSV
jgi:hypothetical protein